MSKDKLEDDAKKRVREETEQIERGDAPWQKSEKRGGRKGLVLPFAGGVSPPFPVVSLLFSVSYPQDRRSYYMFFNYMFFNYM